MAGLKHTWPNSSQQMRLLTAGAYLYTLFQSKNTCGYVHSHQWYDVCNLSHSHTFGYSQDFHTLGYRLFLSDCPIFGSVRPTYSLIYDISLTDALSNL